MGLNKFAKLLYPVLFVLLLTSNVYAFGGDAERDYANAIETYKSLTTDPESINSREIWDLLAMAFNNIYIEYPTFEKAPDVLFLAGKMYEEIGLRFDSNEALKKSMRLSRDFYLSYGSHQLADDAIIRTARLMELFDKTGAYSEYRKVTLDYPDGDMIFVANNKLTELKSYKPASGDSYSAGASKRTAKRNHNGLVNVSKIRRWSTDNYTRVVIHVEEESSFKHHFLKADPELGVPPRLFVDIEGTTVDKGLQETFKDGLLESIRFARFTDKTVRVVLYIRSFQDYRVFALYEPFRIVMDIYGDDMPIPSIPNTSVASVGGANKPSLSSPLISPNKGPDSLAGVLGLKIHTIVIDPGHGGRDPGAIGPKGTKEKDVNLKIAKALKKMIEKDGRIRKVILTRNDDRFIPLVERTAIAKIHHADLFISIHCNASKNKHASGIETYVLSFTNDPESLAVAARENATNTRGLSELADIIKTYVSSTKSDESKTLATTVQQSIVSSLKKKYSGIKNKGVKKAPFVVLIGADVPSILIETSFISNPTDEKRLKSSSYLDRLTEGIWAGLMKYVDNKQTAFLTP